MFLVSCQTNTTTTETQTTQDTTLLTFQDREYSEFIDITIADIEAQLTQGSGTYYVYYYGTYCYPCGQIKNEVLSKIELLVNDKVYLVETNSLSDINENINVEYTPSIVIITDNQAVQVIQGEIGILNIIDSLT